MTVYYVDGIDGADGNPGTSEGSGNAWATIDKAMNTVAAGDKVWVKASGTYSELATIDTVGKLNSFIEFEGYTSTTGDGGKATINGTTSCVTSALTTNLYYFFKNFIFTGASGPGVDFGSSGDSCYFYNCEFTSNGSHGLRMDNAVSCVKCVFANNTAYGADVDSADAVIACKFYGNGGAWQWFDTGGDAFIGNLVYGIPSGQSGVRVAASLSVFYGNTFDGEGVADSLVDMVGAEPAVVANNIFYDATTATSTTSVTVERAVMMSNLINSCTNSYYDGVSAEHVGPLIGLDDVTSAPAFTDEAGDDYSLASDSPARDAGLGVS